MWNTGLIVFFGIWMVLATFLLPGALAEAWNGIIVGIAVVFLGAIAPRAYGWEVFAAMGVGACLCISAVAFMGQPDGSPAWNNLAAGVLLILTGVRATATTRGAA
jgi:hypothetical protein